MVAKEEDKLPHNMAVSYNKKNALQGIYPDISIDYTKALVAQGKLRKAEHAEVMQISDGLKFSWDASDLSTAEKGQRVMMMAYFPVLNLAVYSINGAKRIAAEDILPLNVTFTSEYMETYISFLSTPNNEVADSVYTGSFNADSISDIRDAINT